MTVLVKFSFGKNVVLLALVNLQLKTYFERDYRMSIKLANPHNCMKKVRTAESYHKPLDKDSF